MKQNLYVIYHSMCNDGIAAAWAVWTFCKERRNCIFIAGDYKGGLTQEILDKITDQEVAIVDFSYKREHMEALINACRQVLLIDHHKGAIEELNGLDSPKLEAVLDESKSGALLTWEWFAEQHRQYEDQEFVIQPPHHIFLVDDYDRWVFDYPDTKAFHAAFTFYKDYYKARGDNLLPIFSNFLSHLNNASIDHYLAEGRLLDRSKMLHCESMANGAQVRVVDGVAYCNADMRIASELGNFLVTEAKGDNPPVVGCIYAVYKDGIKLSFRSNQNADCAVDNKCAIFHARRYGGNGHLNAAGAFLKRGTVQYFEFLHTILID